MVSVYPFSTFERSADEGVQLSFADNIVLQAHQKGFVAWPITSWNPLPMATLPIAFEQLRITPFPQDELSTTPFPYDFESSTSTTTLKSANWYTNVDERLTLDVLYRTRLEGAILRSTGHRYEIEGCKDPPYIRMKTIATFARL
jgi:hypothetical protein